MPKPKLRLALTWEEKEFHDKKRWVAELNPNIAFSYYWDEFHKYYVANTWLRLGAAGHFKIATMNVPVYEFENTYNMERCFFESVKGIIKIMRDVEAAVLDKVIIGVVFNKDGLSNQFSTRKERVSQDFNASDLFTMLDEEEARK